MSLEQLAKLLGTNVNYISKAVNCYAGTNFKGYLNKLRTNYAQELILKQKLSEEISFKEIAETAGFNSTQTFYRAFKNITGSSPKIWTEQQLLARDIK